MKWIKYFIPVYGLILLLDPDSDIYDWDKDMFYGVLLAWYQTITICAIGSLVIKLFV